MDTGWYSCLHAYRLVFIWLVTSVLRERVPPHIPDLAHTGSQFWLYVFRLCAVGWWRPLCASACWRIQLFVLIPVGMCLVGGACFA